MSANKDDIKPIGISDEWPYYMKLSNQDIQLGEWQLCPKCNGQGVISKPYHVPGDVTGWGSNQTSFICDVCNGAKILARPIIK